MTENDIFTIECEKVFRHIKENIVSSFPTSTIMPDYFVLSVLENENCVACKALSSIMTNSTIDDLIEYEYTNLKNTVDGTPDGETKFNNIYDTCIDQLKATDEFKDKKIDSGTYFIMMLDYCPLFSNTLESRGVSRKQINDAVTNVLTEEVEDGKETSKKKTSKATKTKSTNQKINESNNKKVDLNGEVERNLINLNRLSVEGKIDEAYYNDEVYSDIFRILSKKNKNNVLLISESGIGKTATVKHLANLLTRYECPKQFYNKQLAMFDFVALTAGTGMRGGFEIKFESILNDAKRKGCYIFFIDDIHSILSPNSKFTEVSTDALLNMILSERSIMTICTTTPEGYSKLVSPNKSLARNFQVINLNQYSDEKVFNIVKSCLKKYEDYHDVSYSDELIDYSIKLANRYITDKKQPESTLDLLDEVGAKIQLNKKENTKIVELQEKLVSINEEIEYISTKSESSEYDRYDSLIREQLSLKNQISKIEKQDKLNKKKTIVQNSDVADIISNRFNISVGDVSDTEKDNLKKLPDRLKSQIIGQDEAIDIVAKVVKRQRVGLGNPNRPVTLLSLGSTGVGKTLLAKKLAEDLFGSEKNLVRIDMSEYSDKISVNKLVGSSPGYVGYDEGGVLTEAIKRNSRCVLLLDEIEKANEEVFNILLQVFDDGRLTDNKGITVSFKDVIIMMTSNVGAVEVSESHAPIGFNSKKSDETNKEIVIKALKKKFKPEFINRIDEIIHFNSLTDENIKSIVKLEVNKVCNRIESLGYNVDNEIRDGKLIDSIYEKVKEESEYGARPVIREVQRQLEDKVADYIIDNAPEQGHEFKLNDIY